MPKAKKNKKRIEMRIPAETLVVLEDIVRTGLLGRTLDDVVEHILREGLYRDWKAAKEMARKVVP